MEDGTRENYELLAKLDRPYLAGGTAQSYPRRVAAHDIFRFDWRNRSISMRT